MKRKLTQEQKEIIEDVIRLKIVKNEEEFFRKTKILMDLGLIDENWIPTILKGGNL